MLGARDKQVCARLTGCGSAWRRSRGALRVMRDHISTFRAIVGAGCFCILASPIVDIASPSLVYAVHGASAQQTPAGWTGLVSAASWLTFLSLVATAISTIGLLLLKRWSRYVALAAALSAALSFLPIGEISYTGASFSFASLGWGLWGAAIALSFSPGVNEHLR